MKRTLIAAAVLLVAAVIIGLNVALRRVDARHRRNDAAWNARIDAAGLRYAGSRKMCAYLRQEHLRFCVYHSDGDLVIVQTTPDIWFSVSKGFHRNRQDVWIDFDDNGRVQTCTVWPFLDDMNNEFTGHD